MSNPARHVIYASQRRERSSRNNVKMQKKCEGQHLHGGCNINLNDLEWCHHGWSMMVVETHMFLKMLGWNRIISHQMRSWRAVTVLRLLCFRIVLIHCGCICEWWWTYVFYILYYLHLFLRTAILHQISIVLWHVRPFCLLLHCFPTTTAFQCEVSNGNQWNRGDTSCRGAKISGVIGNWLQMESIEAERRKQEELEARKREEDFAIGWSPLIWKTTLDWNGGKCLDVIGCN